MRRIRWAAAAALAALTLAATALPATADPDVFWKGYNGRVVQNFAHPTNAGCSIQVAVDLHRGYLAADSDATYRSGVVRSTKVGANVLRHQIEFIRVGANDSVPVVTDHRPSKFFDSRDNGLSPADTLNSDADYPGNVTNVVGYTDSLLNSDADTDPTNGVTPEDFKVRGRGSVRCTDNTTFSWTLLSNTTSNDA